jgi:hypothetical protein
MQFHRGAAFLKVRVQLQLGGTLEGNSAIFKAKTSGRGVLAVSTVGFEL